ncbi:Leucine-rich repeat protein 2, partial [Glycine soja]
KRLAFCSRVAAPSLPSSVRGRMSSLVFVFALFVFLQRPLSCLSNSQVDALSALRSRLSDPKNVLESWDTSLVDPCTWFHVTCDSNNNVIRLDLGHNDLSGTLAPELAQLSSLQYLELYGNQISGTIPEQLGNLKSLISMDLYDNLLEGNIPNSFGNLKSLKFLRLNNNKLTGSIPKEVIDLNLQVLDVSNNNISESPADGNLI